MSELAASPIQKHGARPHLKYVHHVDPEAAAIALKQEEEELLREKVQVKARRQHFYLAGRLLLASLFVTSGLAKLANFGATTEAMTDLGLAAPSLLLTIAIGIELIGGALLAAGYLARSAATVLIGYLAAVTLLVHGDWSLELNRSAALANFAFAGGLLMLLSHGAGTFSLDKVLARREALRLRN